MPAPSNMVHVTSHPKNASIARAHQIAPTMLCFSPKPRPQPAIRGPNVLEALEALCATPCSVPSTLLSGTELFTSITVAGREKVLDTT